MPSSSTQSLIVESLSSEIADAKSAGQLGFMARAMVLATMPHTKVTGTEFKRKNGNYTLTMVAPSDIGLPYGTIPRLLLCWLTTEAAKTKNREIILGETLSHFMKELGMIPTGGRWGSITRLKDQMTRLFACTITGFDDSRSGIKHILIAEDARFWWHPKSPDQASLWNSTVHLSQRFYDEITATPVPIDLRALKALKRSPFALDIYCWLTYRFSYLSKTTPIPWELLQFQFGANYNSLKDFKKNFRNHAEKVLRIYPDANITPHKDYLLLKPSKTHIPKQQKTLSQQPGGKR